jgi:hypothetical protein
MSLCTDTKTTKSSADVTSINEYRTREVVGILLHLLDEAQQGRVRGLALTVKTGPRHFHTAVAGDCFDRPHEALGIVTHLQYKLNQLLAARDGAPETESMPL